MDFHFTEEQEQFRKEIRDFLEDELRQGSFEVRCDSWHRAASPEFSRKLAERGWIGLTWPQEYGGQGRSYLDRLILTEELLRFGAPVVAHWGGDRQIGPSLLTYGSEEQKRYFLPKIARAEIFFCAAMSEPNAGSDLASLQAYAVEHIDRFVIQGQKVWTTGAQYAHYCYLVARTNPSVPKHRGISEFIVDMKLKGIVVRPIIDMTGSPYLSEIFFDNVNVPKNALIGQKDRGFYQIASQLDYERGGIERLMGNYPLFIALIDYVAKKKTRGQLLANDVKIRHRLAELVIELEVGRLLVYRVAWLLSQGFIPNYEAALAKAYCTEFEQRLANTAMQIVGLESQLMPGSKWAVFDGEAAKNYLHSPAYTIQGGTGEILRNIIATRGLGLPVG